MQLERKRCPKCRTRGVYHKWLECDVEGRWFTFWECNCCSYGTSGRTIKNPDRLIKVYQDISSVLEGERQRRIGSWNNEIRLLDKQIAELEKRKIFFQKKIDSEQPRHKRGDKCIQ